jgi:hypothetical protein
MALLLIRFIFLPGFLFLSRFYPRNQRSFSFGLPGVAWLEELG